MLSRGATVPAVLLLAWCLGTAPLLVLGGLVPAVHPVPALLLCAAVAVALLRLLPSPPPPAPGREGPASRWPELATLAVCAAAAVGAALLSSENVLVRRDPAVYAQTAHWLSEHGRLAVQGALAPFGGPSADVTAQSPGFYAAGDAVVPQFLHGTTSVLAALGWVAGWRGVLVGPALATGLGLLALAGLAARLLGRGWAPVVAAVAAVSLPVAHVARSTYSEPFAMLLLLGGLCLLVDALRLAGPGATGPAAVPAARAALVAGLLVGGGTLVRVDSPRETALLLPLAGWLLWRAHPAGRALVAGLAAGTAAGSLVALVVARDYLAANAGSVVPLLLLLALSAGATAAALALLRRSGADPAAVARRAAGPAPVAAGLVVLAGLALAARPLVLVVRRDPTAEGAPYVGALQQEQGLEVDPGRLYDERTVQWLAWWLGAPLLLAALAGAALLALRLLRGRERAWWPVWLVGVGTTLQVLLRSGITPDHPWAERRFAAVVVPAVVLLAAYAARALLAAALARWAPPGVPHRDRRRAAAAGALAALLAGPVLLGSGPLLPDRTEAGQLAALRTACAAFSPGEVALLVDGRAAREWPQPLRGCGVPAASVPAAVQGAPGAGEAVARAAAAARAVGSEPVLVGAEAPPRAPGWGPARQVVDRVVQEDARLLEERPAGTVPLAVDLWLARPAG
ncbi:hypothetical protein [Vallicoccus soli]|uniref:hypothetical protein n=1 Tax=Vallicoccus soli TaxID=2339232 RepID=UPI001401F64C|nr:hypothetical protein [Vallicoccus soli]